MHSAILVLLVTSGLLGVSLSQTPLLETTKGELKHETVPTMKHDTGIWVKSTELRTKPTPHFWSTPKHLSTELNTGLPLTKLLESTHVPSVTFSDVSKESTLPGELNSAVMDDDCKRASEMSTRNNEILRDLQELSNFYKNVTVQKLNDENCTIEVTSVSHTNAAVRRGVILVNGKKCGECNNKMNGYDAKPGLSVCVIHPSGCRIVDERHFQTDNATSENEGEYLKTYLENLGDHLTVVGTSCGDGISGMGMKTKILLKALKASVDDVKKNGKFAFVVQTKEPSKGLVVKEEPSDHELKLKCSIRGENSKHYHCEKENV